MLQLLALVVIERAVAQHILGGGHDRLPAWRLGQGVQTQVFVEGAGLRAGSVHIDPPQLALLCQHDFALAGPLLPGIQGELHGLYQRPAQRLVILLANEVVGQRTELATQAAQLAQQLFIFDDSLPREVLEGVLQRHYPVLILTQLGTQSEGESGLSSERDGQGTSVEHIFLPGHQKLQIVFPLAGKVGPLLLQRGGEPLIEGLPLHGFRLLPQQACHHPGGKQHCALLVDKDHGVGPFAEQGQQPLLILMQPILQGEAMFDLLLQEPVFHQ